MVFDFTSKAVDKLLQTMAFKQRHSKFKHVFGTPYKKDLCYDNVRITKSPWDSNMCDVNGKFLAVVLESQGGGGFIVIPLEKVCHLYKYFIC